MLRVSFASLVLVLVSTFVGCGGSNEATSAFDKSELEKYAEENPVPYIDPSDPDSVEDF